MRKVILTLFASMVCAMAGAQVQSDTISIRGHHGLLRAIVQHPSLRKGKKCDAVIIMHGFGGQKTGPLETSIANQLGGLGYATIRFDFNGHGESEGEFRQMTVPNEIEDALSVFRYVRALPYVSRIGLVGHSQGGVVASMTAGTLTADSVAAVALLAPAAVLRDDAIRGNTMGAFYDPLNLKGDIPLMGGRLVLGKGYVEAAFSLPIYETAARYTGPAFIIHGTSDRVVPYTYGERYHEIWKGSQIEIIPAEDHGFMRDLPGATKKVVDFLRGVLK